MVRSFIVYNVQIKENEIAGRISSDLSGVGKAREISIGKPDPVRDLGANKRITLRCILENML
jgi:hypothetical protein